MARTVSRSNLDNRSLAACGLPLAIAQSVDDSERKDVPRAIEQHYNATRVAALLGRCDEWVVRRIKAGDFGPVSRDDGGWLIPASSVNRYLAKHVFSGSVIK